jgi:cytochrome c oxidase subunit 3
MPASSIAIKPDTRGRHHYECIPPSNRVPGSKAIWVAIFSEMTEFALMFGAYFLAKSHYPGLFNGGPTRLNTFAGTVNTLILLSSSFCVARAMMILVYLFPEAIARWTQL